MKKNLSALLLYCILYNSVLTNDASSLSVMKMLNPSLYKPILTNDASSLSVMRTVNPSLSGLGIRSFGLSLFVLSLFVLSLVITLLKCNRERFVQRVR